LVLEKTFSASSLLCPSLAFSDEEVYEPEIRALLGTTSHFREVVVQQKKLNP
jgi:hypothetical protein